MDKFASKVWRVLAMQRRKDGAPMRRKVRITRAQYKRDEDRLLAIITSPTKYDDDTAWRALRKLRKLQADNSFSSPRRIHHES